MDGQEEQQHKTERMMLVDPTARNKLIGDELVHEFIHWAEDKVCRVTEDTGAVDPTFRTELVLSLFCRWLVETGPGAEALRHINAVPRQLWLDYLDRPGPWEVRDV